jgi:ASC-1-like (ASCH) protein
MDPVDVLTMGAHAAQLIRSGKDPEKIIQGAYKVLKLPQPEDGEDSLALRIVRLTEAAGEGRDKLMKYLNKHSGPLPLNRPTKGWGGAVEPAAVLTRAQNAEAEELVEYVEGEEESARDMSDDFPSFSVAEKRISGCFGGRTIITRKGKRLTEEKAGEIRVGDSISFESEGLPATVHGLIDYPLERPCLFTIEVGEEPWELWEICCAFADQYARIYEEPEKYGIWGHDMTDLWIERLLYYPEKQLIYPHVGS